MHRVDVYRASKTVCAAIALAALLVVAGASAQAPSRDVTGVWIDHTGQGAVEITACGDRICGHVVWLKDPNKKSKSGKPICGTPILGDLQKHGTNEWEAGWIYNPEDEERFSAALKLANPNTLLVTGYLGIKLLGETFTWKRAQEPLARCASRPA